MRTRSNKYIWLSGIFLLLLPQLLTAANSFARCRIGKEKLQWGEVCHITLAVYTRTWFTEGVAFPEMIEQSGVLLKQDRSYTSSEIIDGERYSVIAQDYLYYPLSIGKHHIRFNDIEVNTPPIGEYKGKKQKVSFPQKNIEVYDIYKQNLRQTTAVKLKAIQHFEMPDTLRVGDVVMRNIDYIASGVPAAFIVMPEIRDTLNYARTIQEQPAYFTKLKNGNVSGQATQKILYQLTDSGTFTLPSIQVDYRSLKDKQVNRIALEGKLIHILPPLYTQVSSTLENSSASAAGETDGKGINGFMYVGFVLLSTALFLFIKYWRKQISQSIYWQILSASGFPQLYDTLYEYSRSLHFRNFGELADENVKLRNCYDELMLRLFKEGCLGRVNRHMKLRLLYLFMSIRFPH